jgi:DNA-binding transcriptional LysR family regulator
MLDGVSLDQLRTFIAAVDEGSFSAAGRRLRRAQSVVSKTLANMEGQLDVKLFERRARPPVLTDQGRALLAAARVVTGDIDLFKARAKSLAGGLEAELSMVVDVMFPVAPFIDAVAAFQGRFPATPLRLDVEAGDTVLQPVLDGRCAVGVMASWPYALPPQLTHELLLTVETAMVVAPRHALAAHRAPIPSATLSEHIQLLHLDLSDARARELGVMSSRVWRLGNLQAKHSFLRAGFGFGIMPLHVIERDLASGTLVRITAEETAPASQVIAMSAVYRPDNPPGPAGRWFIDRLKQKEAQRLKGGRVNIGSIHVAAIAGSGAQADSSSKTRASQTA